MTMTDLSGKVILITGASRGIGRAVAIEAAKNGAEIILTGRTTGALEEVDDQIHAVGGNSVIVELDQTDFPAIPRLAAAIGSRWQRLDGFVANAGQLGQLSPIAHSDEDVFERTITVNLTSIFHMIKAFDGLLRASAAGRAVLVSSGAAVGHRPFWGAYAVSKAGLEAMGRSWASESEQTNMKINMIDPGGTRTAMRAAAYPGEDPMGLPTADDIAPAFMTLLSEDCPHHGERLKARDMLGV
ncbi:MAG: SDR family NAD(P)-dependent oxidoreductase [Candidatus Puniceispirillaceae bacterium]